MFIPYLHRSKILLPPKLLHLHLLLIHILCASILRIRFDLPLDSRVERAQDTGCKEGGVDAVVDSDGCDGDAYLDWLARFLHYMMGMGREEV